MQERSWWDMRRMIGFILFWMGIGMLVMLLLASRLLGLLLVALFPVSYTHLDVYKRQVLIDAWRGGSYKKV